MKKRAHTSTPRGKSPNRPLFLIAEALQSAIPDSPNTW